MLRLCIPFGSKTRKWLLNLVTTHWPVGVARHVKHRMIEIPELTAGVPSEVTALRQYRRLDMNVDTVSGRACTQTNDDDGDDGDGDGERER